MLSALTLSGCFYQTATENDIARAVDACKNDGGLESVRVIFDGRERAVCKNTKEFLVGT